MTGKAKIFKCNTACNIYYKKDNKRYILKILKNDDDELSRLIDCANELSNLPEANSIMEKYKISYIIKDEL